MRIFLSLLTIMIVIILGSSCSNGEKNDRTQPIEKLEESEIVAEPLEKKPFSENKEPEQSRTASIKKAQKENLKEKIELKKAYQEGKLKLTFTAKDEGKAVDLTIKNVASKQLVIFIEKGNTVFNTYAGKIFLVSTERKEIELTAEAEKTLEFPIKQEGAGRWTSGSIILSVSPKEDKKP